MLETPRADPKSVALIILGGGIGTSLFPLTSRRAKPAVPIGGCYRLIDIPMSNCINSGIRKIFILMQFNSFSLNRHLSWTYNFDNGVSFGDGFVEVLATTQTPGEAGKRQFIWVFEDAKNKNVENILILSGDHLYRTLKISSTGRIIQFAGKPKGNELKAVQVDSTLLGLSKQDAVNLPYIALMGVYVFKSDVLLKLLRRSYPSCNDFSSEIIPSAVAEHNVQDIGTIKSFFDTNLALTEQPPKFELYDPQTPFYTSPRFLPPSKVDKCRIVDAIISHGCFLQECSIEHSIVGVRLRLDYGVEFKDTVMMGADYYKNEAEIASLLAQGKVPIGGVQEADRPEEGFYIRSGITVILKNATIKDGTVV
ncbi:hypothetical protein EUGRSUZ_L00275 [Eucalyptus grandis]|uniref:Uncharacterized protein n=2 Tax=Eucalyptus grandis TaxID=71139 RepID=A0ACC3LCV9_EUCGR|nr:hypothetical protein EUGRSUZ_L00275 [Eucalyptus grandis]